MRLFLRGITVALASLPFVSLPVASSDTYLFAEAAAKPHPYTSTLPKIAAVDSADVFRRVAPTTPLAQWPEQYRGAPWDESQLKARVNYRRVIHRRFKTAARAPTRQTQPQRSNSSSGLNIFDLLGNLPDPVSQFAPATTVLGSLAGGAIAGGAWALITTGASTSLRENRELSNQEACQAFLGAAVPLIGGFIPWGDMFCKPPVDVCYNPEYVSYNGLRQDDPIGRFERWVRWMKKYCPDVKWQKYADRAHYFIYTTSVPD